MVMFTATREGIVDAIVNTCQLPRISEPDGEHLRYFSFFACTVHKTDKLTVSRSCSVELESIANDCLERGANAVHVGYRISGFGTHYDVNWYRV